MIDDYGCIISPEKSEGICLVCGGKVNVIIYPGGEYECECENCGEIEGDQVKER